jgi:hypothetical protein
MEPVRVSYVLWEVLLGELDDFESVVECFQQFRRGGDQAGVGFSFIV